MRIGNIEFMAVVEEFEDGELACLPAVLETGNVGAFIQDRMSDARNVGRDYRVRHAERSDAKTVGVQVKARTPDLSERESSQR